MLTLKLDMDSVSVVSDCELDASVEYKPAVRTFSTPKKRSGDKIEDGPSPAKKMIP